MAHWTPGGHKKDGKRIARARRNTDLEVQPSARARVSGMSGSAPDDARCLFCPDGGDAADPLIWVCVPGLGRVDVFFFFNRSFT